VDDPSSWCSGLKNGISDRLPSPYDRLYAQTSRVRLPFCPGCFFFVVVYGECFIFFRQSGPFPLFQGLGRDGVCSLVSRGEFVLLLNRCIRQIWRSILPFLHTMRDLVPLPLPPRAVVVCLYGQTSSVRAQEMFIPFPPPPRMPTSCDPHQRCPYSGLGKGTPTVCVACFTR